METGRTRLTRAARSASTAAQSAGFSQAEETSILKSHGRSLPKQAYPDGREPVADAGDERVLVVEKGFHDVIFEQDV